MTVIIVLVRGIDICTDKKDTSTNSRVSCTNTVTGKEGIFEIIEEETVLIIDQKF